VAPLVLTKESRDRNNSYELAPGTCAPSRLVAGGRGQGPGRCDRLLAKRLGALAPGMARGGYSLQVKIYLKH
jgi:hypothetical protein